MDEQRACARGFAGTGQRKRQCEIVVWEYLHLECTKPPDAEREKKTKKGERERERDRDRDRERETETETETATENRDRDRDRERERNAHTHTARGLKAYAVRRNTWCAALTNTRSECSCTRAHAYACTQCTQCTPPPR
eukprot:1608755-Rhodomonas_salina.1